MESFSFKILHIPRVFYYHVPSIFFSVYQYVYTCRCACSCISDSFLRYGYVSNFSGIFTHRCFQSRNICPDITAPIRTWSIPVISYTSLTSNIRNTIDILGQLDSAGGYNNAPAEGMVFACRIHQYGGPIRAVYGYLNIYRYVRTSFVRDGD